MLTVCAGRSRIKTNTRLRRFSDAFKEFAPKLHQLYEDQLVAVMARDKTLTPPFPDSVFACAAFNFPPNAISIPHRDHLNVAYGWCSITALGNFSHQTGGLIVLPQLKVAIVFPAGSSIFIPSALLDHYNLPIGPDETRSSITQFTAGGIFRRIAMTSAQGARHRKTPWKDILGGKGEGLYNVWPQNNSEGKPSKEERGRNGAQKGS